jgi:hypothetical protein
VIACRVSSLGVEKILLSMMRINCRAMLKIVRILCFDCSKCS